MGGDFKGLHNAGGTNRVHATDQTAGQIGRQFSRFAGMRIGVVTISRLDVIAAITIGAKTDILIGLHIADGKGVMQFNDIEVFQRIGNAGHSIAVIGGHSRREKTGKAG